MPGELRPFRVGDWLVDPGANRISTSTRSKNLRHKAMELLVLLAQNAERTVSREEIIDAIWEGNDYVGGKGITNTVWALRQAFGDTAENPRYIETIPKKGYRLRVAVELPPPEPVAVPAAEVVPAEPVVVEAPAPGRVEGGRRPGRARLLLILVALAAAGLAGYGLRGVTPGPVPVAGVPPGDAPPGGVAMAGSASVAAFSGNEEYHRTLSPDGKRMAFAWRGDRGGALYVRTVGDPDDVPVALVAKAGEILSPTWSPSGLELAYLHLDPEGRCRIFVYDLASRRESTLTSCYGSSRNLLNWSPDGRWLAFSDGASAKRQAGGLHIISPDGKTRRQLTESPNPLLLDMLVTWTPDSTELVFTRPQVRGFRSYYVVDLDGRMTPLSDTLARQLFASPGSTARLRQREAAPLP